RRKCPLCDEAKEVLRGAGVVPIEVDVDTDPDLQRRFTNDVPVIYIDGVEAFRHRVSPQQLSSLRLAQEKCVPCRGGVPPLKGPERAALQRQLDSYLNVIL